MSAHPRVLTSTVTAAWPPGSQMPMTWQEGELVDATPGSLLESAIGSSNLRSATLADYLGHSALQN